MSDGKITGKFPVDLRSFALPLHFYSPRAYCYIRSLFQKNLPPPSTLRSWYSQTDVTAGFTQKSLDVLTLKSMALERTNRKLVACLMMDEMAIKWKLNSHVLECDIPENHRYFLIRTVIEHCATYGAIKCIYYYFLFKFCWFHLLLII